jgi:hypothetical protein
MSETKPADPVKLFASLIAAKPDDIANGINGIAGRYGKADFISGLLPFDFTGYYAEEMGAPLLRRFIALEKLIRPEMLPDVKLFTNELEGQTSENSKRRVNIDPGYISACHLILATGKGYAHRPYLRDGIYADLTLLYRNQDYQVLEWTYPDYAHPDTREMLKKIRKKYLMQLNERGGKQ